MSNIKTVVTRDATILWKALNGIFAIYKPKDVSVQTVKKTIITNLCRDLNEMDVRQPIDHVQITGETNKKLVVTVKPSYADHINIVGPRYQEQDIKLSSAHMLPKDASGLVLFGIGSGISTIYKIRMNMPTQYYRVTGKLGEATATGLPDARIIEKTTYHRIRRHHLDKICASYQSSHQKTMFAQCGVDIQSQEAYEIAKQGLIRPKNFNVPLLYSIKCINFRPPMFTLEIVCISNDYTYLQHLIHYMGMQLKSTATCVDIQSFQYGAFNSSMTLLTKHWTLHHILNNINVCRRILESNPNLLSPNIHLTPEVQRRVENAIS